MLNFKDIFGDKSKEFVLYAFNTQLVYSYRNVLIIHFLNVILLSRSDFGYILQAGRRAMKSSDAHQSGSIVQVTNPPRCLSIIVICYHYFILNLLLLIENFFFKFQPRNIASVTVINYDRKSNNCFEIVLRKPHCIIYLYVIIATDSGPPIYVCCSITV